MAGMLECWMQECSNAGCRNACMPMRCACCMQVHTTRVWGLRGWFSVGVVQQWGRKAEEKEKERVG